MVIMVIQSIHITNKRSSAIIFDKTLFHYFIKQINFKTAIKARYPCIPWELVMDPLESAEHTLRTTALEHTALLSSSSHYLPTNGGSYKM
jgi:hypothetical protein